MEILIKVRKRGKKGQKSLEGKTFNCFELNWFIDPIFYYFFSSLFVTVR